MSTPRLLPGPNPVVSDLERDFDDLLRQRSRLEEDLRHAKDALKEERERSAKFARVHAKLRGSLEPLYSALRGVFTNLDEAGVPSASEAPTSQNPNFWETQKRRFPGKAAQIIDLLLERPMSVMQIVTAGRMDRQTVYNYIGKLSKAGLVEKNGGLFTLKEL